MTDQTFPIWLCLSLTMVFFIENYIPTGLVFLGIAIGLVAKAVYEE